MKQVSSAKAITTSFFVDLCDIVINVVVMIFTGSVVMLAESLEGATDLVASALLLIGLRISKRRRNKMHPFGHGKALFFWTLISAIIMLIFGAGSSIYFGVQRFLNPTELSYLPWAYVALTISIITNGYALSLSTRRLLYKEKIKNLPGIFLSSPHVETKNTFILDFTGTTSAVLGLISLVLYQAAGIKQFDAVGAILIGILIAVSSLGLIWGVKDFLLGKTASEAIEQKIREAALEVRGVSKIIELDTMYIGSEKLLVHLDIKLMLQNKNTDNIVEKIKLNIKAKVRIVYSIQIEVKAKDGGPG